MNLKKVLKLATLVLTLTLPLICCKTTSCVNNGYVFPDLEEATRYDDGLNIIVLNDRGEEVFIYNVERDTVTIPRWYWKKVIKYGINTGGIKADKESLTSPSD